MKYPPFDGGIFIFISGPGDGLSRLRGLISVSGILPCALVLLHGSWCFLRGIFNGQISRDFGPYFSIRKITFEKAMNRGIATIHRIGAFFIAPSTQCLK